MRLEQTIRETISESVDLDARLQQLVRAGLMPQNTLPLLRKAIAKVQAGMSLQGAERDVMGMFINSMMYIVLGDDTIFNKARAGAKGYAAEEVDMGQAERGMRSSSKHTGGYHVVDGAGKVVSKHDNQRDAMQAALKNDDHRVKAIKEDVEELDENSKIVAHLVKRYGDNVRKSHIMSAAKDFGVDASKLSKAVRKHLGKTMLEANVDEAVGDYTVKTVSPADAYKKHTGQMTKKSKVPVDPKTGKTLYQKVTSEETEEEQVKRLKSNMKKRDAYLKSKHGGLAKIGSENKKEKADYVNMKSVREEKEDDLPFEGPYRKTGERKDEYGNKVKNVAKHLAKKAMKNEEVEELDEISKKTLGSYVKKAAGHAAGSAAATAAIASSSNPKVPEKVKRDLRNRMTGISKATDRLTKEEVEDLDELSRELVGRYARRAKDEADYGNPLKSRAKGRMLAQQKRWGDKTSYIKPAKVMATEDVEQIDERDEGKPGKMFAKIAAKAAKKYGSKEAGNRVAGAIRKKVLAKEDIEAVKQMNESYRDTFNAALEQYGVKSPSELDEEKRKEFFNFVDQNYKKGDN